MDSYFSRFPEINYNGYTAKNIMLRTKLIERVYNNPKYFYTLEIRNNVRPDKVAFEAYDDQYLSWLIYLSNNIVDPYYQWSLSQYQFTKHIETKYGNIANAQNRVVYWQNNWYNNPDNITIAAYNAMEDYSKQYYEPVLIGNKVLEYRRKQLDWTVNTNQIWEYSVTSDINASYDQKITIYNTTGQPVANGQVLLANSTVVRIQHVFGQTNTQIGTIRSETGNTTINSAKLIAKNIPDEERVYWSEVTFYDLENEKNANNSNIKILSRDFSAKAALQLKRLLNP